MFQSFPTIFFELIQQPPTEAENYQFASVEVKQLAFRIDGVFLPQADKPKAPIYFAEVQFQPDIQFYRRFFAEIFLYLSKTDLTSNWRGVVIYPNRQVESQDRERYQELLDSGRVQRLYLNELADLSVKSPGLETVQLIVSDDNQAVEKATDLIQRVQQEVTDAKQQRELLQLIETVLIYKLPRLNRQEIEAMFTFNDLRQTQYFQDVFEEGRQEGKEEGRQEGKEEGRQEGKLASVPLLLKLGATPEQIAETLNLPLDKVQETLLLNPENSEN